MAFRQAARQQYLRLLLRAAQAETATAARAEPCLNHQLVRGIATRSALLAETAQPMEGHTAQGPPYAVIGGAVAATGALLYMLFGGNPVAAPVAPPVAEAEENQGVVHGPGRTATPPIAEAEENQSQGMGQAHVGDYKVQSHTGSEFTHDELHGEFGLIYFGQSSHPDTVSELERLAEVVSNSDRLNNMHYLNPVFVSVDPKTDTSEKMAHVVSLFDTNHNRTGLRLIGITGPDTQKLHEAALRFGDRTHKPADKPDTTFFFISPDGSFVKAYSGLSAPKEIAEDMSDYIVKYKRNNPTWHGPKKVAKRHA